MNVNKFFKIFLVYMYKLELYGEILKLNLFILWKMKNIFVLMVGCREYYYDIFVICVMLYKIS